MIDTKNIAFRRLDAVARHALGALALLLAPFALGSCTSTESVNSEISVANQAVVGADCGYEVSSKVSRVSKKGFKVKIKVANVSGVPSTGFSVLVNSGTAQLVKVGHGTFQATENGYLMSPVVSPEDDEECDRDDETEDLEVLLGRAYRFHLKFEGAYSPIVANMISNNAINCDQAAPSITLSTSSDLFTSNGTLTLRADATDNVAVSKVVFSRDGVAIGTDRTAPYALEVSVAASSNGRHRYEATVYDLTGNAASQTKRVLVAIGNKFFGTAATTAADYADLLKHFNQLTPGNAGKWGSVEPVQDQMNWADLDTAYAFAKTNAIPFKLHTLIWGQQQPAWIGALPPDQQLAQIDQWMAALAERYPNVDLIDVVNEPLHAPPSYAAALGGAGTTGWDWAIKAFEMAREHFPNAELLLNDYSILTLTSATQSYLGLIKLLGDRGLIDGIGEQGHFYERAPELSVLTSNLNALTATGLPVYISELDLNLADDALQANRMRDLFTAFWSNPSVLGITHWGYLQGNMWQPNSYLQRTDGTLRPALTWIDCYRTGGTDCPVPTYVPQPRTGDVNAITLQAEEYDSAHALLPAGNVVAYASDGAWLSFSHVVFNNNWNTLSVIYAQGGTTTPTLTIHLDSLDNPPVASIPLAPTGGWATMKTLSIPWALIGSQNNVFIRFNGGGANLDKVQFAAPTGTAMNVISDSDFESGTTDGWWTWGTGTVANTTARSVSGGHALVMTGRAAGAPLVESLTSVVVPGKTYKVSLWATVGASPSDTVYVTTALQCSGGATSYGRLGGWGNSKTIADGTWVEFSGDLVVPDCALANVAFWLEGPAANVDLYIDHVSVRAQTSANIINNGTFESGTTGWSTWGGGGISASTARAHGGTQSLLVTRTSNAPAATDITSVVKPGTNYPFSLWVSIHTADGSNQSVNVTQAASCRAADGTVSTSYAWVGGPVTVTDGANWAWVQISGTIAVPNCTLTQMQFWVEGAATADQLFVDDVQLIDQSGGSTNLIPDGTFEAGLGAWGGWGYGALSVVSTSAHSGAQSLMGAGMQANSAIARDIKAMVAPGKRYQATVWVTVGSLAAGSGSVKFQTVQSCNGTGTDSYPWLSGATVTNSVWSQLTGTVDLSACTSIEKLQLFVGADSGDLYLDDVTLTLLP